MFEEDILLGEFELVFSEEAWLSPRPLGLQVQEVTEELFNLLEPCPQVGGDDVLNPLHLIQ